MWPNPQETAILVTFTEEILNGKHHFLCSGYNIIMMVIMIIKIKIITAIMIIIIIMIEMWQRISNWISVTYIVHGCVDPSCCKSKCQIERIRENDKIPVLNRWRSCRISKLQLLLWLLVIQVQLLRNLKSI